MAIKSALTIFVVGICLAWMVNSLGPLRCHADNKIASKGMAECVATTKLYSYFSCCIVIIAAMAAFKFAPI